MTYWSGLEAITARVGQVKEEKRKGARKGLGLALLNTLNVSNQNVPHEEGDLERDGGTAIDGEKLRGVVAYGRSADAAKYAVVQHERMDFHHDAGRSAKYLENALNSTRAQNAEIIGAEIRTSMGAPE